MKIDGTPYRSVWVDQEDGWTIRIFDQTKLPWALEIDLQHRPAGYASFATFHPTFLYELLWNLAVALVLVVLDRRFRLGHGKVFTLYVLFYTLGRFWIEALRIDSVNEIAGFRLNNYTALVAFVVAAGLFLWLVRTRPGREAVVEAPPASADEADPAPAGGSTVPGDPGNPVGTDDAGRADPADPADADRADAGPGPGTTGRDSSS